MSPVAIGKKSNLGMFIENGVQECSPQRGRASGTKDVGDQFIFVHRTATELNEFRGTVGQRRISSIARQL
jgi:hypothetical protein